MRHRLLYLLPVVALTALVAPAARAATALADPNGPPPIPSCSRPIWPGTLRPLPPSPRVDAITIDGVRVNVLVPPGYRTGTRRYPVLYLLHGGGQWQDLYLTHTDLESFTARLPDVQQAIVVMPDGAMGIYQDTRDGSPSWERFHLNTVLPYIDAHYRTIADRAHRAITGESGGGLGTMDYAARHPDLFVAASSMSGLLDISSREPPPLGGASFYSGFVAIATACNDPGDDPRHAWGGPSDHDLWQRNENPTDLAPNLRGVSIRVATGNGVPCDRADANDYPALYPFLEPYALIAARHFTQSLTAAHVVYTGEFPACGTHSFRYFQRSLHDFWPQMLAAFDTAPPTSFDYRRADSHFSVWGWTFRADPRRAGEFVEVHDASAAGVTLTGSGVETVTTAGYFTPNQDVHLSDGRVVRTDGSGRLTFAVDLGPAHTLQQYTAAERVAEATAGSRYWTTRTVEFMRSGQ